MTPVPGAVQVARRATAAHMPSQMCVGTSCCLAAPNYMRLAALLLGLQVRKGEGNPWQKVAFEACHHLAAGRCQGIRVWELLLAVWLVWHYLNTMRLLLHRCACDGHAGGTCTSLESKYHGDFVARQVLLCAGLACTHRALILPHGLVHGRTRSPSWFTMNLA